MIKTFYYLSGKPAQNDALAVDWKDGVCVGNIRVGRLGCYFSRGLKYFCVPFAGAHRAFGRVREVMGCVGCGCVTKRPAATVVFCTDGREVGEVPLQSEAQVQRVLALLRERCPDMEIGIASPTDTE